MRIGVLGLWAFTNLEIAYALLRVDERRRTYLLASLTNVVVSVALTVTLVVDPRPGRARLPVRQLRRLDGRAARVVVERCARASRCASRAPVAVLGPLLRFGVPTVPADATVFALNVIDRAYLLRTQSAAAAGLFALSVKLATAVILAVRGFQLAWPPLAYSIADDERARRFYAAVTTWFVVVTGLVVAGLTLLGRWVVRLLAAPEYFEAHEALPWVALGWAMYGLFLVLVTIGGRAGVTTRNFPAALAGVAVNVVVLRRARRAARDRRRRDRARRRLRGDDRRAAPAHAAAVRGAVRLGAPGARGRRDGGHRRGGRAAAARRGRRRLRPARAGAGGDPASRCSRRASCAPTSAPASDRSLDDAAERPCPRRLQFPSALRRLPHRMAERAHETPAEPRAEAAVAARATRVLGADVSAATMRAVQARAGNRAAGRWIASTRRLARKAWHQERAEELKAALKKDPATWDEPGGAYYILNGLNKDDQVTVLNRLAPAERQQLEDNLAGSKLDRAGMYQSIQQVRAASDWWTAKSNEVHAAIGKGDFVGYPTGAYWIINPLNDGDRVKIMTSLSADHLDALIDNDEHAATAGVPNAVLIAEEARKARATRKDAQRDPLQVVVPGTWVDEFKEVLYDIDYRIDDGGSPSNWMRVVYKDGARLDLNWYDFEDVKLTSTEMTDALKDRYVGPADRIVPRRQAAANGRLGLTRQLCPRLWAMHEEVTEIGAQSTIELMKLSLSAVMMVLTMPAMPVGPAPASASPRVTRRAVPRPGPSFVSQQQRAQQLASSAAAEGKEVVVNIGGAGARHEPQGAV